MRSVIQLTYGIVLCVLIGMVATFFSLYLPLGSVAIAILLGLILGNSVKFGERFKKGITFSEKRLLSLAIALMGVKLNYRILQELGYKSIVLIVIAMGFTIGSSLLIARLMNINTERALLLGIGNGVCGSSAIAATQHIIGAREEDVGLSVAIVNFLGTIGMFLLPFIGTIILNVSDIKAGILIGNTLQAVGQVTAGGFSISDITGQTATIVKMGRILMLTPLILILLVVFSRKTSTKLAEATAVKIHKIPLFIIGFMLFSLISTFRMLPEAQIKLLGMTSHYALLFAMAAVGLKLRFANILRDGKSALVLGSILFLIQITLNGSAVCFLF